MSVLSVSGRLARTHQSQFATMVDFIENHPQMLTHRFIGANGRDYFNKLWEELTVILNSMGFGNKDPKKWQEVITFLF